MLKKRTISITHRQHITDLLEATEQIANISLCVHDFFQLAMLPGHWQRHHGKGCAAFRQSNLATCKAFDGKRIHQELANQPNGQAHICPFALPEIAMPIVAGDVYVGVLFAGDFPPAQGEGDQPLAYLEPFRLLLACVAKKIGEIFEENEALPLPSSYERSRIIMAWLEENMDRSVRLVDLAKRLCLSPSRTASVVRKHFNMSFTELVQSTKLNTAAYWLSIDDSPVGIIAHKLGYCDQAYFTRLFTRRFGKSPANYRKESQINGFGA